MSSAVATEVRPEASADPPPEPRPSRAHRRRRPAAARRAVAGAVGAVGLWALGMFVLYREVLVSGFEQLQGNIGDQRLNVYLSEHWFDVAKGHSAWRDPEMFFPVTGVLGYTDSLILYQPSYVLLRVLGADQFLAYQLTLMVMSTIGFASAAWFLRSVVRVRFPLALVGAWLFAFANALGVKTGHSQVYALNLVPIVASLAAVSWRSVPRRPRRAVLAGAAAGLLLALLLFTSFYIGWFLLLVCGVVGVCLVVGARPVVADALRPLRAHRTRALAVAGATVVAFLVGLTPFLVTYLPTLDSSGGRTYQDVLDLAGRPHDLVNVGYENLVWSDVLQALSPDDSPLRDSEGALAVSPMLVAATVLGAVALRLVARSEGERRRARVVTALVVAGVLLALLPIRFGDVSAWAVVWAVVPGAHAIRAIYRLELLNNAVFVVALVLVLDVALDRLLARRGGRRALGLAGLVVLAVALGAEQVQVNHDALLSRDGELAALAAVPPPPPSCRAFAVVEPPADRPFFAVHLDAMLISTEHRIPTVNGYSGVFPPGWGLLDTSLPTYPDQVSAWLEANGLTEGMCGYDLTGGTWRPARS